MSKAVRAIVINDQKILIMFRDKSGSKYATLVGGGIDEGESPEQALVREVKEETGLDVTSSQLVFIENNARPYADQYIYLCQVKSYDSVALGTYSEEAMLNKLGMNLHEPMWIDKTGFKNLSFRTPQLQNEIVSALKNGFPTSPKNI